MGPHACMYVCHVYQDTSPLCYASTDAYLRYLCSTCYHEDFFFYEGSSDVYCVVSDKVRPEGHVHQSVKWVHVCVRGPCVEKYHASNFAKN